MKRSTPMKRTPLRATAPPKAEVPLFKLRKCPVKKGGCATMFRPARQGQLSCLDCAVSVGAWLKASKSKTAHKEDVKQTRAKLEALKTVPKLKKEAQEAFNAWVRARDASKPCFVCGATLVPGGVGGSFDAGHIRSRSNADNLRFDVRNVHGQCKPCNAAGATKDWEMKAAAIRLLGADEAEALYNDNAPVKWTRDGLREIRDQYRLKAKQLEKETT